MMYKGVKYFKLDVSMANRKSCTTHSTWNQSGPCFISNNYADQYCCLALRGDASSEPDFNYNFNTT